MPPEEKGALAQEDQGQQPATAGNNEGQRLISVVEESRWKILASFLRQMPHSSFIHFIIRKHETRNGAKISDLGCCVSRNHLQGAPSLTKDKAGSEHKNPALTLDPPGFRKACFSHWHLCWFEVPPKVYQCFWNKTITFLCPCFTFFSRAIDNKSHTGKNMVYKEIF